MQKVRRLRFPVRFIALLLVFTISFFAGKAVADWTGGGSASKTASLPQDGDDLPVNRLNVLLLGIDARPGEKDSRTDSIILVSIDRETKKMALVSVPRDTLVQIPGHGKNKINTANAVGGAELAMQTVSGLLDVEIHYYVKTNFEGFKEIVDTLGGVEIEVEKRMYYPAEDINLKPGLQRLDGYNALGYVRFRHDALGDITRTERQQKFLAALGNEMLKAKTILKAPVLVPKLMKAVDTNLGVSDALFLARVASKMDPNSFVTATLPGTFYNYKGASFWKADEEKARVVLNELFHGIRLATVTGPDITVPVEKRVDKKPKPIEDAVPKESPKPVDSGTADGSGDSPGGSIPGDEGTGLPGQDTGETGSGGVDSGNVGGSAPGGSTGSTDGSSGSSAGGGTSGTSGVRSGSPGGSYSLPPDAGSDQSGKTQSPGGGGAAGSGAATSKASASGTTVPKVNIVTQG